MEQNVIKKHYNRWLFFSPLGLALIGFGLSLMTEAAYWKHSEVNFWSWFGLGTLSLIVINTGISFFGQGIIERVLYLTKNKKG